MPSFGGRVPEIQWLPGAYCLNWASWVEWARREKGLSNPINNNRWTKKSFGNGSPAVGIALSMNSHNNISGFRRMRFWEAADLGNCPKSESSRKWLGEGAKGLLDPASKRPLALVRNGVAPVQKRVWGGGKDSWETFAPWDQKSQKDLLQLSPNHFLRLSLFGQFPRSTASQNEIPFSWAS